MDFVWIERQVSIQFQITMDMVRGGVCILKSQTSILEEKVCGIWSGYLLV